MLARSCHPELALSIEQSLPIAEERDRRSRDSGGSSDIETSAAVIHETEVGQMRTSQLIKILIALSIPAVIGLTIAFAALFPNPDDGTDIQTSESQLPSITLDTSRGIVSPTERVEPQ